MNYKDQTDTRTTDQWLESNGIAVRSIYVGSTELFQAQMLATRTLKDYGRHLAQCQADILNKFLQATRSDKKRSKITQGQCFNVMNIAKQAQRRAAKYNKARR
jgi:hypothetical protein